MCLSQEGWRKEKPACTKPAVSSSSGRQQNRHWSPIIQNLNKNQLDVFGELNEIVWEKQPQIDLDGFSKSGHEIFKYCGLTWRV